MKESGEMHLKSTIYESTLSTATRSPFPNGEDRLKSRIKESTLSPAIAVPLPHAGKAYAERRFASIFYKMSMPESGI